MSERVYILFKRSCNAVKTNCKLYFCFNVWAGGTKTHYRFEINSYAGIVKIISSTNFLAFFLPIGNPCWNTFLRQHINMGSHLTVGRAAQEQLSTSVKPNDLWLNSSAVSLTSSSLIKIPDACATTGYVFNCAFYYHHQKLYSRTKWYSVALLRSITVFSVVVLPVTAPNH
jgi:hypothetical protein